MSHVNGKRGYRSGCAQADLYLHCHSRKHGKTFSVYISFFRFDTIYPLGYNIIRLYKNATKTAVA